MTKQWQSIEESEMQVRATACHRFFFTFFSDFSASFYVSAGQCFALSLIVIYKSLLSHCFVIALSLLFHCFVTDLSLLLCHCFVAASSLLRHCFVTVSPLLRHCFVIASSLLRRCCFVTVSHRGEAVKK